MRNKVSTKLIFALLVVCGASGAATQELYVAGPVENLAADGSQLTVLGQTISVSPTTRFFLEGRKISASRFAQNVGVGSFVYADLSQQASSLRATNLLVTTTPYVAGASAVFVAGRVESYSPSVGRIRIGALDVDVTSISPDLAAQLSVGDEVQIAGVQPSLDRPFILASDLKITIDAEFGTLGISGSGTQGISGSGSTIQGISGSGTLGISGSGSTIQGISGSGTQGISGSGSTIQGISGSGTQGISGSGSKTLGISGSGTQGISGSGTQGISGSGSTIQGISGSGTL